MVYDLHKMTIKGRLAAAVLLLLPVWTASAPAQQISRPRLILVLSIDQMRADYLTRFDDLFTGGFRTLLDRGAVFTNAMYRHASTETGPGHSVILSGRHPSSSGIVGNDWFDPLLGRAVNVVEDPFVGLLGSVGRGASPANFTGFTLGDALKQSSPDSRVVGVSLKDRAAILMAGRLADGAFWFDLTNGHFVTSTYYLDDLPSWLERWNARNVADTYAGQLWTRLLKDESVYETYAGPDDIDGEWDREDTVFPHKIRGNASQSAFYDDLRRTPFSDRLIADVALEALNAYDLGEDASPDILAVGFSGTDYIGHTYGPDSQELMDQMLRLDLLLGEFFGEVDERVGLDRTLIVLTADHGVMPLVEVLDARGVDARRVDPRELLAGVLQELGKHYENPRELLTSFGPGGVYFNRERLRARGIEQKDVEDVVASALMASDDVAAVYTREELAGTAPSDDPYLWLYRNAFFPARSPHLEIRLKPYLYPSSQYAGGTGHGTAYEYDRRVPIIVMGNGIPEGSFPAESGPEDIAPTLGAILGLSYPKEPDARILEEILP